MSSADVVSLLQQGHQGLLEIGEAGISQRLHGSDHGGVRRSGAGRQVHRRAGQCRRGVLCDEVRHTLAGSAERSAQPRKTRRQGLVRPIGNVIQVRRSFALPVADHVVYATSDRQESSGYYQTWILGWAHAAPSVLAAFFASLVECVEALTIVLAIGAVRGWRSALGGSGAALLLLLAMVAALGPALARIPIGIMQLTIGRLLLLFGMRWLRKAILRAAGVIPLHDEAAAFAKETARLRALAGSGRWDLAAAFGSFQITMLEGIEVVFIVLAIGAGSAGLLVPASLGALAALLLVIALGVALHRPLASIPENSLKFVVGILLAAFGTFWVGEGLGISWPGADWAILGLAIGFLLAAALTVWLCRQKVLQAPALVTGMERA